eukprot:1141692-Pelagomonas_calceolata.AAC.2
MSLVRGCKLSEGQTARRVAARRVIGRLVLGEVYVHGTRIQVVCGAMGCSSVAMRWATGRPCSR